MKRKEIASLLNEAGTMMDSINGVEMRSKETGEVVGTIPDGEIKAMQTAFAFCRHMLVDTYEPDGPMELVSDMIMLHGGLEFGLTDGSDD